MNSSFDFLVEIQVAWTLIGFFVQIVYGLADGLRMEVNMSKMYLLGKNILANNEISQQNMEALVSVGIGTAI